MRPTANACDPSGTSVRTFGDQSHRPGRDRCQRHEIQPVMLEDRLERSRIAAPHEMEEAGRDLESWHVADATNVEQRPLERRQPAAALHGIDGPWLPQPASRVQCIEMRDALERHLHAMKEPARLHHRQIERLPVVADDQIGVVEELGDSGEERALGRIAGQQELTNLEGAKVKEPAADQKRDRAGAAAQPRRFEIDEHRAPRAASAGQLRIQQPQAACITNFAFRNSHIAMPAIGFVPAIDDQTLAKSVPGRASTEHLTDAVDRRACFVATDVGLVGQLSDRLRAGRLNDRAKA